MYIVDWFCLINTIETTLHELNTLQPSSDDLYLFYHPIGKFQQLASNIITLLYDFIHNPLLDQIKLVNNLELQKIIYCNVSHPPPFSTNKNKQ